MLTLRLGLFILFELLAVKYGASFALHSRNILSFAKAVTTMRLQPCMNVAGSNMYRKVDVVVIGGGIAGTAISWSLQEQKKLQVAVIDPHFNSEGTWYPNYGEWRDEWHHVSHRLNLPEMKACTTTEWNITDCFFGGSYNISMDKRTTLSRPYVRVDRIKLQALLKERFFAAGGIGIDGKVPTFRIAHNIFYNDHILHTSTGSTVTLDTGEKIDCKVVIDATGFESRLIARESSYHARNSLQSIPIGYQIAYGFIAHVDFLGPYDYDAMTLFDYRSDHLTDPSSLRDGNDRPTFMYTMPLEKLAAGGYRVFFEETSLVGRDKRRLGFEECKVRAMKRLAYHNINIIGIEEEEYCYIPMGGELPDHTQRVIAFGAAANMVHPSTGYQACRMLASVADITSIISDGIQHNQPPGQISTNAYCTLWNRINRKQRDFQVFGGDFLMAQNLDNIRGFFTSFFALDMQVWSGYLAGYAGLPNNIQHESWDKRLRFASQMFVSMPFSVTMTMVFFVMYHTVIYGPNSLLRSLTPDIMYGSGPKDEMRSGPSYEPQISWLGDVGAKEEARMMMRAFKPTAGSKAHDPDVIPAPYN